MASEEGVPVDLYIYDLTHGLASQLSQPILGRQIEGIWHTSIVLYDREFFFGGAGVVCCRPGSTQLGSPNEIQRLGRTFLPFQLFEEYVHGLSISSYTGSSYHLIEHNCNHFTEEVAQFLCSAHVPKHVLLQADQLPLGLRDGVLKLLDSALGQTIFSNGGRYIRQDSPEYLNLNTQIEEARLQSQELSQNRRTLAEKLARKERKKEKKRKKELKEKGLNGSADTEQDDMAEAVEATRPEELTRAGPSSQLEEEDDERRQEELRKRARDPPIVFRDIDGVQEFENLSRVLEGVELNSSEKQSLEELQQYLVQGEGSWVLGDEFLAFIGRLLRDPALADAVRVAALRCLAAAALREDVSLALHQDRRDHCLMNHAHGIDAASLEYQRAMALFICNLFENVSSSEWLLYISEWEYNGQPLSNIRATTKVAVHATLSEDEELRDIGTAIMYNIATKEVKTVVFDDVCVELAMALLQLLQLAPREEQLWRGVRALARLVHHSADLPPLVAMVGPHPEAFRGTSQRVDEQIDIIKKKVK